MAYRLCLGKAFGMLFKPLSAEQLRAYRKVTRALKFDVQYASGRLPALK